MQRQQLQFLSNWLNSRNRKPLIIRGARQVGKSTLVELFAEKHKKKLLNVNLERHTELAEILSKKTQNKSFSKLSSYPICPLWIAIQFYFLMKSKLFRNLLPHCAIL
jgi:predicted AAA+ superfamily ATPase